MQIGLDSYLGVHQDALKVQSKRMEVLADNLANVDTPNYKARDIDFRTALAQAADPPSSTSLRTTDAQHIAGDLLTGGADSLLKYRIPLAPSLDGNTVDAAQEQAAFADSSIHYQASLSFLSMRLKNLLTAITGQ